MIEWLYSLFEDRTFGAVRSSAFAQLSRDMIEEAGRLCRMGLHKPTLFNPLNTHHVRPFHEHPKDELKKSNLIVLCRLHHFIHAHFRNWASSNPRIREDAEDLNSRIANRP